MSGRREMGAPAPEGGAAGPAGKKRRLRRLLTYACGALLALVAVLYLLRGTFIEPFLKSWLTATVRDALGPTLEIGDISGSYITGLELRDIETIEEGTAGPLLSLDARRLALRYSLLSLLGGRDAFLGRIEVDLQGARASLLTGSDGGEEGAAAPVSLPGALPRVRISDSSLSIAGAEFVAALDGIDIDVDGGSSPVGIEIRIGGVHLAHDLLRERTFSLGAGLRYTPGALTVGEVLLDDAPVVKEGRLSLEGLPAAFSVEVQAMPLGGDLAFRGEQKDGAFSFFTEGDRLDVGRTVEIFRFETLAPGGILSFQSLGRVSLQRPLESEAEISLLLEKGTLRGTAAADLRLEAGLRDGTITVGEFEGTAGESSLSLRDGSLPLARLVSGEWRDLLHEAGAAAALESRDVPSFLSLWGVDVPQGPGETPVHELRLEGRLARGTLDIHEGALDVGGGVVALRKAVLTFPAPAAGWEQMRLEIDGDVDLEDAAVLTEVLPLPPLGGTVRGRVRLEGALEALQGELEAEARGFAFAGRSLGDITLSAAADSTRIEIRRAELRQGETNLIGIEKVSLPPDDLLSGEGRRVLPSLRGEFSLRLEDVPRLLETLGINGERKAEVIPKHLLSLDGRIDGGEVVLSSGRLETPQGSISLEQGRAVLPGEGEDLLLTEVDAGLTADLPDLLVLAELFSGPPLGGALSGSVRIRGPVKELRGSAAADIDGLAYGDLLLGDAALEAAVGEGRLDLQRLEVRQNDDSLAASGSLILDGLLIDSGSLDFSIGEVADYTTGLVPEEWQPRGSVEGRLTLSGAVTAPEGDLEAAVRDGAVGIIEITGAEVSLSASSGTVRVRRFEADTSLGAFSLTDETQISYGEGPELVIGNTSLQTPPGVFRLGGSIGPDGSLDLAVDAEGLSGEGWLEEIAGDRISFAGANLTLRAEGSLARPRLSARGTVAEITGRHTQDSLQGDFDLLYDAGTVRVNALSLVGRGGRLEATGTIPARPAGESPAGPLDMALVLDIPALDSFAMLFPEGYSPRGLLRGEALVGGSLDSPAVQVALEAGDLILPDRLKAAPPGPFTVSMKGSWAGSDVLLDTFRVDSEDLTVEAAGNWRGAPAPGALLRGEGARLAGDVVLEAGLDAPDLAWIAGAVAGFRQAGGSVTGSLKASGPVTDPDVSASLEIKGGEVSFTGVPLLSSLDGSLVFAGKKLTLHDVAGELGGSPMQLEGSVSFGDDWEPAFDLHIAGERLLLYRDQGVRVRADTEMSFTGPLAELAIAGTVSVVDSFFSRNIDLLGSIGGQKRPPVSGKGMLFSFRDPPLRDLRFNVALKAVDPFLIRNQFLRASVRPDLVLKGTGVSPVLAGRVFIDPSRLFLPAGTLRTEKGAISFREQAPDRPWIDLEGTTRLMGYDISMNITGFADDPRITLSSLPPLPNDELLLLVLLGTPPASGETEVAGSAGTALAVFLGRGFLNRFFGSGAETEEMILDRFETTIGRDITDTGEPTVESTFRLGEGFLWEGDTLFLTGEKDRYDEVNYGVRLTVEFRDKEKGDE